MAAAVAAAVAEPAVALPAAEAVLREIPPGRPRVDGSSETGATALEGAGERSDLARIITRALEEKSTNLGLTNGVVSALLAHGSLSGTPLSQGYLVAAIINAANSWDTGNRFRILPNSYFSEDVARALRIVCLAAKSRALNDPVAPSADIVAVITLLVRFAE